MTKQINENEGFLPTDYTAPVGGDSFLKFTETETNFRALSPVITGYEYWDAEKNVYRSKEMFTETPGIKIGSDGKEESPKHFWAFVVWDYGTKEVKVLQISQRTIQKGILNLVNDEDWGNPQNYDIKVTKTGKDLLTRYQISPKPKKPLTEEISEAYAKSKFNLDDMYFGDKEAQDNLDQM